MLDEIPNSAGIVRLLSNGKVFYVTASENIRLTIIRQMDKWAILSAIGRRFDDISWEETSCKAVADYLACVIYYGCKPAGNRRPPIGYRGYLRASNPTTDDIKYRL